MKWILACIVVFTTTVNISSGSKILVALPLPIKSHSILFDRLVLELTERGHQVTYISPFPVSKSNENLTEIVVPITREVMTGGWEENNIFMMRKIPMIFMMVFMPIFTARTNEFLLNDANVRKLINSDEKFDLIIGESFCSEAILTSFAHKFDAPVIGLSTLMATYWSNFIIGNPAPVAYIPDPFVAASSSMTFLERTLNTVHFIMNEIIYRLFAIPKQEAIRNAIFGDDLPPLVDVMKNTSLVLVNHHHTLAFPRPKLPNMIEIGGFHVKKPKKLPEDLQKYLDESKDGAILFSLGTNVRSADMSKEKRQGIIEALGKLKQNVLWKFEDDTVQNLPKNIKISNWLPQSDILAHPNVKLFITHGGLLSTTEAVVRGVPIVGIPITGDQPINMVFAEQSGIGLALEYEDITNQTFYDAITEVLNNPKYTEAIKLKSKLLTDTPMSAIDTAIYWIEYVIRHKGAHHLRSSAQDLEWYQLYSLDVVAFLSVIFVTFAIINIYSVKFLFRICRRKGTVSTTKKND